ncbi:hypothetical protein B0A81_18630 [Flavobacterium plurextorum]|uniref:Response regulatory domain-containing protein n=1 Tax=Flavobacterium plurextorum TaxID=1114867 RepID=A0ABX4CPV3_9FLAO|nr:response regulator [Flavobacterium plurextorum]OXB03348.1 hypothetical protein B0A81_18630 [Flavobacterium plurextorum]
MINKYKAIIVDDEINSILLLKHFIRRHCVNIEIIGEALTADSAVSLINKLEPDILLLDIWLHGKDIFEVLDHIKIYKAQAVFVTSHDEYALKAMKYIDIDYILKPVIIEDLIISVNRAVRKIEQKQYFDFNKGLQIRRKKNKSL